MRSARVTLSVAALAVLLALSQAESVFAAVIDQKQEVIDTGTGIFGYNPMGQEFIPSMNTLHSVELHISRENPGGDTLTVRIRSGSISGPVLATASVSVAPGDPSGWISFSLGAVTVTIGATYVIQLTAATQGIFQWDNKNSGNPYPRGRFILLGVPQTDQDAAFRTYGSTGSSVGGVALLTNTLTVLAPCLAVIGLVATAAVAVKRRVN